MYCKDRKYFLQLDCKLLILDIFFRKFCNTFAKLYNKYLFVEKTSKNKKISPLRYGEI